VIEHALLPKLCDQLRDGSISRREFIRFAALLGVAAGAAYAMTGLSAPAMADSTLPFPAAEPGAKRGGKLRIGEMVARMEDPATYGWNEMANQTRPILEYLTLVGPDNVVRPMLIESWTPSADLKTWTLQVRRGVMWHNGEELTAEHVAWNIRRWSDPALGSSNLGLSTFAALTEYTGEKDSKGQAARRPLKNGVEVLGSHALRLNLAKPVLSVPEDCGEFCTLVVHPSFKPPLSRNPIGTGPYTLAELRVSDRCILKRITKTTDGRDFRYWGGEVYLDEIHSYHYEGVARAFAGNPAVVVADEPLSALDVSVQAAVTELLIDIQRREGTTLLFISHDLSVVRYLSDRIVVMYLGQIMEQGTTREVFAPPYHPYTEALLAAVPIADQRYSKRKVLLTGDMPSASNPPAGCRFSTRCPYRIEGTCDRDPPPVQEFSANHRIACHLPREELLAMQPVFEEASS
jgi:oligopeptide/dipeptide ABC transporter ATP-binding protein